MNVIKYDIEVKNLRKEYFFQFWRKRESEFSVKQNVKTLFEKESEFDGEYQIALQSEWNSLDKENIRRLNHSNYLVGYITKNNTKIFLFELDSAVITGRNNVAIQVYAFGTLPIEDILNETFTKIKSVLTELSCSLINKSLIYIYPFNTNEQDIESTELKIKASLQSIIKLKSTDIVRWGLVIILGLICLVWALSLGANNPELQSTLKSVFGSGIFYVLLDLIITVIVPFLTSKHKKKVIIENLSSVLERTNEIENLGQAENLEIPQD